MIIIPNFDLKGKVKIDKSVANSNFLEINNDAIPQTVYGIEIKALGTFFVIFWEERHLIHVPEYLFLIIDSGIPKNWVYKKMPDGEIVLYPNLFLNNHFSVTFLYKQFIT